MDDLLKNTQTLTDIVSNPTSNRVEICAIIHSWESRRAKGGFTLLVFRRVQVALQMKEGTARPCMGDAMIIYQDFLFCTFIVTLISLLYQIFKDKKK